MRIEKLDARFWFLTPRSLVFLFFSWILAPVSWILFFPLTARSALSLSKGSLLTTYLVWFNHRPKECGRVALLLIRYAREAGFVHEVQCRCEDETGRHVVPVTEIGTQHIV